MSVADRLLAELQQPEPDINLARAALYVAQTEYPDLDVEAQLGILDEMAAAIGSKLPESRYPLRVIQSINDYLYGELGFVGNTIDYYDPRNSFLNDVLVRRTGIPLTLAVVYLEIAQRIDFPMVGIGMPGHFLVAPDFPEAEIFIDTFNGGEVLFAEDCRQKLMNIYQQDLPLLPPELIPRVSKRQIIGRMLNNLQAIYFDRGNLERGLTIKKLMGLL
jgi:regulator of sirC expression with transglutaminase-like and TPR domain